MGHRLRVQQNGCGANDPERRLRAPRTGNREIVSLIRLDVTDYNAVDLDGIRSDGNAFHLKGEVSHAFQTALVD